MTDITQEFELELNPEEIVLIIIPYSLEQRLRAQAEPQTKHSSYEIYEEAQANDPGFQTFLAEIKTCAGIHNLTGGWAAEDIMLLTGEEADLQAAKMELNVKYTASLETAQDFIFSMNAAIEEANEECEPNTPPTPLH